MPRIVTADGDTREDSWILITSPEAEQARELPDQPVLLPLQLWLEGYEQYAGREDIGVWLDSHEEPETLAHRANELPLIAVNFPKFTDGRGYSTARLLRERYGYHNELRAIGDVLLDQLQFMKRCGFDTYALRPDKDFSRAAHCLRFFSCAYQAACDTDQPLFRRRLTAA